MSFRKKIALPVVLALTFGVFAGAVAQADDDHESRERSRHNRSVSALKAPENTLYKQECSSCHFLYQPWLLPSRSWQALLDRSHKNFAGNMAPDPPVAQQLSADLTD